jgi:hypothetical protein
VAVKIAKKGGTVRSDNCEHDRAWDRIEKVVLEPLTDLILFDGSIDWVTYE